MGIHPSERDAKFEAIWSGLIEDDAIWAMASLKRIKKEYYDRQRDVFKLLKDKKGNLIVKESDQVLKEYVEEQGTISEAITWHDAFRLVIHCKFLFHLIPLSFITKRVIPIQSPIFITQL